MTEHDDRVLCAACVKAMAGVPLTQRSGFVFMARALQLAVGVILVWTCFHLLGRSLLAIPGQFHDGSVWKPKWFEEE